MVHRGGLKAPAVHLPALIALFAIGMFVAFFVRVGADCYWLVAMGRAIVHEGAVPVGVPFAEAPSGAWPNVLVLAELVMSGVHALGPAGLPVLQLVVDLAALSLVALGARKLGAGETPVALVLLVVALGSLTSLVIVRLQVFSLIPFATLLLVLRSQHARPTARVWWVPPLLALWSNLHGAVLVGLAVTGAYLVASRLRIHPGETVLLGCATLVAPLVTPAGWRTVQYYLGVLDNEAARRGSDLWARPDPSHPFDLLLILAGVLLIALAVRVRLPVWEYLAVAGLALGTATAGRYGVWLLMFTAAPAATALGVGRRDRSAIKARIGRASLVMPAVVAVLPIAFAALRAPDTLPAEPAVVAAVTETASGRTVLAPEPLVESLAVAGARVWVCDPIDAFEPEDQAAYLNFLSGSRGGRAALEDVDVVAVENGSRSELLVKGDSRFTASRSVDDWTIYTRLT
jgi:hypothetical protein